MCIVIVYAAADVSLRDNCLAVLDHVADGGPGHMSTAVLARRTWHDVVAHLDDWSRDGFDDLGVHGW